MSNEHFDAGTLSALLAAELSPGQARGLIHHLHQGCAACDALLDAEGVDLDLLLRLVQAEEAQPVPAPVDLVAPAATTEPVVPSRQAPRQAIGRAGRRQLWVAGAALLAMAAAVMLSVLPSDPGGPGPQTGVKGTQVDRAPSVQLRVVAGHSTTDGFDLDRRVADGQAVGPDQTLLFELQVDRAAARSLLVVDGQGKVTVLSPGGLAAVQAAGSARVRDGGQWVALALDDVVGPLTVVALAGPVADSDPADLVAAWSEQRLPSTLGRATLHLELLP